MLSPHIKRNIRRILPFGIIWVVFGWVFLFIEHAAAGGLQNVGDTAIKMDFGIFVFATIAVGILGTLVGAFELAYLDKAFSTQSFGRKFLYKILIYGLIFFLILLITFPVAASMELDTDLFDRRVWDKFIIYLTSITFVSTLLQLSVSLVVSLFYSEVSENIGREVLRNFFTGKYHKPIEEERVFMFLDMKSSTTIAEKLGHSTYFTLLKEYYADLSRSIVQYGGEVYQYVGDEIVISWDIESGLQDNNCVRCFFDMQDDLSARSAWYQKNFSLTPSFKAGLHCGTVTAGEIGVVRKDILFTGDVLNATARIQGLCNTYHVDILLSGELVDKLDLKPDFEAHSMGRTELRGRQEDVEIFTLSRVENN